VAGGLVVITTGWALVEVANGKKKQNTTGAGTHRGVHWDSVNDDGTSRES